MQAINVCHSNEDNPSSHVLCFQIDHQWITGTGTSPGEHIVKGDFICTRISTIIYLVPTFPLLYSVTNRPSQMLALSWSVGRGVENCTYKFLGILSVCQSLPYHWSSYSHAGGDILTGNVRIFKNLEKDPDITGIL